MGDKGKEERIQEFREWEYSLEGIHNSLGGCCAPNQPAVLTRTIFKLPREVQDEILGGGYLHFVVAEGEEGFYWREFFPPRKKEEYRDFIFLSLRVDQSEEFQQNTIAHEIAHFVLKHTSGGPEVEKAADDLAEKWGFGRAYLE